MNFIKKIFRIGKLKLWQDYCENQKTKHHLSYLFWECTLNCNLGCQHCGSSCGSGAPSEGELNTDEIKNAFEDIAKNFNPKDIMIAVTGGEPLLRKDIFEVMSYATGLGFSWGMVSNGTLITQETVDKMAASKMSTISISLDGQEKNHNWLRGQGSFKKTIEGIKLLVSSKKFKVVEILTSVNQNNINELEEIYKICEKLKVDQWRILIISPIGRAKDNSKLFLNNEQLTYLFDYIKQKRKEKSNKLKVNFCDEGFLGIDYEGEVRDQLFYCWAGISIGSILYNGDIGACPILPREHTKQGNIRNDNFADIWNNKYGIFRDRSWKKCANCKKCEWWDFCEGGSLHSWNFKEEKLMICHHNLIDE